MSTDQREIAREDPKGHDTVRRHHKVLDKWTEPIQKYTVPSLWGTKKFGLKNVIKIFTRKDYTSK